ncbi:MAG TPA: aminopeptidase P family protein [Acidimicrobiales bacterium]|nr:aminopeptidase P family protein [Acidimicrobiales bacterium]
MAQVSARVTGQLREQLTALPPMDLPRRVARLRDKLGEAGCEALLVSDLVNVRYLTGFSGSAGLLLVKEDEAVLVTDGRYKDQAQKELAKFGAEARCVALKAQQQLELLAELSQGLLRLGLEAEHLSWAKERRWAEGWAKDLELVATSGLVEGLRERKDAGEIARIAAAAAIADAALAAVRPMLEEHPTEAEVATVLDAEMRRLGAEGPAFDTIVAAGPSGAEPHHRPSERRINSNDLVVLDFGAKVDGYHSDMTRSIAVAPGDVDPHLQKIASVVLTSQEAGLCAVRDGVPASEIDRACREVIEAAGMGELFVHGTGHGVGLEIHESPALAGPSDDILASGQVVTVEPGVYVPGLGGSRTEDTVLVTEAGCEVLTMTPKQTCPV